MSAPTIVAGIRQVLLPHQPFSQMAAADLDFLAASVEVAYFGLMPHAIGRGLGGWFLAYALQTAFERSGTQRVHLNTCTTDGPNAMANYRARGLTPYREAVEWRLPESPLT